MIENGSNPHSLFNFVGGLQCGHSVRCVTPDDVSSIKASIDEFKARCARNGICPNDSKPCKYYRNCVLDRCDACLNHSPKRNTTHSTITCVNCKLYPGKDTICKDFVCMTAYRGR